MSLAVEQADISAALLADGWHVVDWAPNDSGDLVSTFRLDSFDLMGTTEVHTGPAGFSFSENGQLVAGPATSILAVKLVNAGQATTRRERHRASVATQATSTT